MKIIQTISTVFIILIAIILTISVLPIQNNFKILVVYSGSMQPVIKTGSLIFVKPDDDYQQGEIITFYGYADAINKQSTITHRIYAIKTENNQKIFITKGDTNDQPDKKEVQPNEIIGKVLFSLPLLGYAIKFVQTTSGFLAVLLIPLLVLIYDKIKKMENLNRCKK